MTFQRAKVRIDLLGCRARAWWQNYNALVDFYEQNGFDAAPDASLTAWLLMTEARINARQLVDSDQVFAIRNLRKHLPLVPARQTGLDPEGDLNKALNLKNKIRKKTATAEDTAHFEALCEGLSRRYERGGLSKKTARALGLI